MRRISAHLLLSLLAAALFAGCLKPGSEVQSVEASAAAASGGPVETSKRNTSDTVGVPEWTLVSPEGDGLLRVSLPSASATCVSDGEFGDGLLESFHVVHAPEGGMFVDFFAREAFLYRVVELESPARLVVDFEPAGEDLKVPLPAEGGNTVLAEPRPRARISDPLVVSGYSRNREAANTVILTDPHGKVLVRRTVRSNDWNHTWGYFEATLDLPAFSGKGTLKVGTEGAHDDSFEGIKVPVWAAR